VFNAAHLYSAEQQLTATKAWCEGCGSQGIANRSLRQPGSTPTAHGNKEEAGDVRERTVGTYNNPSKRLREEKKVFGMFLIS
jgi:hypothetical protein